ncbi:MAG: ABC transporter permease [Nitrospirota bacterium]
MDYIFEGFINAIRMLTSLDREILAVTIVSLKVSATSTLLATVMGVPLGFLVAARDFQGKRWVVMILNTLMSIPSVLVGLLVYSFLSRRGLFGSMGFLYTPYAMIMGQTLLAFPIIAVLSLSATQGADKRVERTAMSLGANRIQTALLVLVEVRFAMFAAIITGFSRIFSEVGVSMMLGGNIWGYTRNITTAIALETGKGEFALGIALGMIMLTIALLINILLNYFQGKGG